MIRREEEEVEWTRNVEIRNKFPAVGEACMATFWPTPGFKGKTFDSSGLSTERDPNFCVRSPPLRDLVGDFNRTPSSRLCVKNHGLSILSRGLSWLSWWEASALCGGSVGRGDYLHLPTGGWRPMAPQRTTVCRLAHGRLEMPSLSFSAIFFL